MKRTAAITFDAAQTDADDVMAQLKKKHAAKTCALNFKPTPLLETTHGPFRFYAEQR